MKAIRSTVPAMAIVAMLQEAVDVAKQNCERAMDIAHKLSLKLREAEDRIAQLEGDIRHYQERAAAPRSGCTGSIGNRMHRIIQGRSTAPLHQRARRRWPASRNRLGPALAFLRARATRARHARPPRR